MDLIDLSEFFNTKPQAEDFSERLNIVAKKIFETGFNPETVLMEQYGIEKKDIFMTLLRNNRINAESRLDIKQFIEKIQAKIASMTVISLVVAFEPTDGTLKKLSQWFYLNENKQVLFDVKIDESLIGGAAILSKGKYLDFSIKPDFERVFAGYFAIDHPAAKK